MDLGKNVCMCVTEKTWMLYVIVCVKRYGYICVRVITNIIREGPGCCMCCVNGR